MPVAGTAVIAPLPRACGVSVGCELQGSRVLSPCRGSRAFVPSVFTQRAGCCDIKSRE